MWYPKTCEVIKISFHLPNYAEKELQKMNNERKLENLMTAVIYRFDVILNPGAAIFKWFITLCQGLRINVDQSPELASHIFWELGYF